VDRLARGVDAGHAREDMSVTYLTSAPKRTG
jgi:hypothetical protein